MLGKHITAMSVFVDIIEEGTKQPTLDGNNNFSRLTFDRKSDGFQADVGDETIIKGRPLKNATINGVTEGEEDIVNIKLKNNAITFSEFNVEGGGGLNLEVKMKGGNPTNKGESIFAKNTITGSDTNDSIKFVKSRFFGNEIDLKEGADTIKFGNQTKLLGNNVIKLGDTIDGDGNIVSDGDRDVVKINSFYEDGQDGDRAKLRITEFGKEDTLIINGTVMSYDDAKQYQIDNPEDYIQIEFLD